MSPKHFWGKDMDEALRAVRNSLGPDALILETKSVTNGRTAGFEITAMSEETEPREIVKRGGPMQEKFSTEPIREVRQEIAALRSMLCWLAPGLNDKKKILKTLVAQGLSPDLVARLADEFQGAEADDAENMYRALARLIPSGGQIRAGAGAKDKLALIGPTGVGKTTAVVKLTVLQAQRGDCRTGWVSIVNRRVAGGDPLAVYASILGVPYERVGDKRELKTALEDLSDCDLVLVDTPGVSPRDEREVEDLAKLLHGIPDLRRTLLLGAAINGCDMADWVEIYQHVGFDSLFFTKLDECRHFGPLINTALGSNHPLSYITLGQNMAGDLEIATPEVLTSILLTGVDNHDRATLGHE